MQRQGSNDEPCSHVGELRVESAVQICCALHANTTLERLELGGNAFGHARGGAEVAVAVASMLGANRTLHAPFRDQAEQ